MVSWSEQEESLCKGRSKMGRGSRGGREVEGAGGGLGGCNHPFSNTLLLFCA